MKKNTATALPKLGRPRNPRRKKCPVRPPAGAAWLPLADGAWVLVDAAFMPMLEVRAWARTTTGHPITRIEGKPHQLHRLIMGATKRQHCVFLNGNSLDCRRSNLVLVERGQGTSMMHARNRRNRKAAE